MSKNRNLTSFCGLYCLDCIPANKELFELLLKLDKLLEKIKFKKYAELKAKKYKYFGNYDIFINVLKSMQKLQCRNGCYKGPVSQLGCAKNCEIRRCVIKKKYNGCWDCGIFNECKLLKNKKINASMLKNIKLIKKYGINGWIGKRGKHYIWQ
jgi:hypothetical protein